jgi:uncharacterized alpha-E superfamily protein
MLSRTADSLYWMARYTERAENTARLIDIGLQQSLLPGQQRQAEASLAGMLGLAELMPVYQKKFGDVNPESVIRFMVLDEENPSSIWCSLHNARENARAVRGQITTGMWETMNTTWLEFLQHCDQGLPLNEPGKFFEWVQMRSHLSRGITIGTMYKDEAFRFIRLGTFIERADSTARMIDLRFQDIEQQDAVSGLLDPDDPEYAVREFYHWEAVLRSLSAFEAYRKVYRDTISGSRVAELLILNKEMPRSIASCVNEIVANLENVGNGNSRETRRRAGKLAANLRYLTIEEIADDGLHGWLTQLLGDIDDLGVRIREDFLLL